MLESLSDRLQSSMKELSKKTRVSEEDIKKALKDVRMSLLEADVNYIVVKAFMKSITEKVEGQQVWKTLNPQEQVIKFVSDELTTLMGEENVPLQFSNKDLNVFMMVGLQGAGKTTMTGKLANHIRKQNSKKPLLIAADIYRPAAIAQLQTLGKQLEIPVFEMGTGTPVVQIVSEGISYARENGYDTVFIDTAGRLHIDETLMTELEEVKAVAKPSEILLVVDAMTGQDAVNVTIHFHEYLTLTGALLTKLDGDARGGAALSIRQMANIPIKFIGTGEKLTEIEAFHPDRMASRILGMGDIMSLIEKAESELDKDISEKAITNMASGKFDLEDFLEQMQQIKNLGPIDKLLGMIPGMNQMGNLNVDPKQMIRVESIVYSMTVKERRNPHIINSPRKRRIAKGSGVEVSEVNKLLKQFEQSKKMMKQMAGMMSGGTDFDPQQLLSQMQNQKGNTKVSRGKRRGGFPFR